MMIPLRVRSAQVIGLDHLLRRMNCQDSQAVMQQGAYVAAVVCDGCGEGQRSETGAALAAAFITGQALALLQGGCPPAAIPARLHERLLAYLEQLVRLTQPASPLHFIQQHLLFTIVGVVIAGDEGVIFHAGDGLLALDDRVQRIDRHNRPDYIAYHLLRDHLAADFTLPDGFTVQPLPPNWQRLALATDGFVPELLPQVWNQAHPRGLQRQLNVWADQERRFQDDATLIVIERLAHETDQA
ncbi:MAG: protein phosphatase 2C domain-containing protein [Anaerolineae bacterium]|jgi:serine/threonine protein phosphatase PrpC|nr:protein phosphatase 2C domain-containing protein [Anaerolineae bacterium]